MLRTIIIFLVIFRVRMVVNVCVWDVREGCFFMSMLVDSGSMFVRIVGRVK